MTEPVKRFLKTNGTEVLLGCVMLYGLATVVFMLAAHTSY